MSGIIWIQNETESEGGGKVIRPGSVETNKRLDGICGKEWMGEKA